MTLDELLSTKAGPNLSWREIGRLLGWSLVWYVRLKVLLARECVSGFILRCRLRVLTGEWHD